MPFHRNFTYYIDKRKWKYVFLLKTLELTVIADTSTMLSRITAVKECDARDDDSSNAAGPITKTINKKL